jgi:hypothetical protein
MQRANVCRTIPSEVMPVALTGQTRMQGGWSQCKQGNGISRMETSGYLPLRSGKTESQEIMRPLAASVGGTQGMLFSVWQATTHP